MKRQNKSLNEVLVAMIKIITLSIILASCVPNKIKITTEDFNRAPIASAQSMNVIYNAATVITLAGTDADSDSLTYTVVGSPSHGSLSGAAPSLTYRPTSGYSGADSFTFKVNDGSVDSAIATVSITVSPAPNIIYLQTNGDDSTAMVNDPTLPFLTAQAAVDAAIAINPTPGNEVIILMGAGSFGDVQVNQEFLFGDSLIWQGADNASASVVGNFYVNLNGNYSSIDLKASLGTRVTFGNITSGTGATITVGVGVTTGDISTNACDGTPGGCTGGSVNVLGTSRDIFAGGDGDGGSGGSVTVTGRVANIYASGNSYGGIGTGGNGGSVTVSGTVTGNISIYGAQTDGGFGGSGGSAVISGQVGNINAYGGDSGGAISGGGGSGGTITVTSTGQAGTINVSGGSAGNFNCTGLNNCFSGTGGSAGTVTVAAGGQTGVITATPGASYTPQAASGTVSLTGVPLDGDTIVIVDGSTLVRFEFSASGAVTSGNMAVLRVVGNVNATAANLLTAITSSLLITGSQSGGTLNLTNININNMGSQGNATITRVSGVISVSGMSGGQ